MIEKYLNKCLDAFQQPQTLNRDKWITFYLTRSLEIWVNRK